ncbi:MAG: hypothetical protein LAN59_13290 [Acidobacteriia bacterium]|nr:hypothetical protein [Terriglobia bacterium]
MRQDILEKTGDYIAQSADKASRGAAAVVDVVEDGMEMAKSAARQGRQAAEDALDGAARRIRRHPVQTVVAIGAVAFGAGMLIGRLLKRR